MNLPDRCGSQVVVACSRRTSFARKAAKLAIAQHQRDLVPGLTVDRFGSCIEFPNAFVLVQPAPKRGIRSDSFSDSYGDFRGSSGIELLSDSVTC